MKSYGPNDGTPLPRIPEDLTKWDKCDAAYIGRGIRCGCQDIAVYDYQKMVQVFIDQGMTDEEAAEWVDYNITGAYIGEGTPIIVYRHELEE